MNSNKLKKFSIMNLIAAVFFGISILNCTPSVNETVKPPSNTSTAPIQSDIDFWLTKADQSVKLEKQTAILKFGTTYNSYNNIEVNDVDLFQDIEGFGYTITGGSAQVINKMSASARKDILQELFGKNENSISINYLRISIGSSDLDASVFSYNDIPTTQTDLNLDKFTLAPDLINLIPVLKEIIAINPEIKIMGSPWSPPLWMKDNKLSVGGSLLPQYYSVYAQYFVKYIQGMKDNGIIIDAITPQNEPLHPGNNPSMYMLAAQEADFIKNNLGPAFSAAGMKTKIIVYDHNCDKPDYPISILNDTKANPYVTGSAFHLYGGDISALSLVHAAFPDKGLYFTEQWTSSTADFGGDLKWHVKNVIIGSVRNWSKVALEWNLASDPSYNPHTPGGCSACKGALTIDNSVVQRNVSYYIVAHASKFVPVGSKRITSNNVGNLYNVAFKTPAGKIVLIVMNDGNNAESYNIKYNGKWSTTYLEPGAVGTYIWQ
jgi:glucosylceramidase